jgi:hypothetical protein
MHPQQTAAKTLVRDRVLMARHSSGEQLQIVPMNGGIMVQMVWTDPSVSKCLHLLDSSVRRERLKVLIRGQPKIPRVDVFVPGLGPIADRVAATRSTFFPMFRRQTQGNSLLARRLPPATNNMIYLNREV